MSPRERAMVERARPRSYYGQPIVKPPVWTWEIPAYFFTGGLAGASAGLAYAAQLAGNRRLAKNAWSASFAGIAVSPVFLIADLGKPSRFLNMLRLAKPTSPMSVGSWILAADGAATSVSVLHALTGRPRFGGPVAQGAAAALGLPLATYTAVLITNTAVPVWSEARHELPVVFAASAAAAAGAAALALTPGEDGAPARRLAVGGAVVEGAASLVMQRRLGDLAAPYKEGRAGRWSKVAKTLTVAGALTTAASRRFRRTSLAGAAMLLGGSLSERFAVVEAGRQSAADPRHTVELQRR